MRNKKTKTKWLTINSKKVRPYLAGLFVILAFTFVFNKNALALESATWFCDPPAGLLVAPGEKINYRLKITYEGVADEWVTLSIVLGEGMDYDRSSVTITAADESASAERELVTGNSGFVLLSSMLSEGDELSFTAWPVDTTANISASAEIRLARETDAPSYYLIGTVEHTLSVPEPEPTPEAAQPTPEPASPSPEVEHSGFNETILRNVVVVCTFLLGVVLFLLVRSIKKYRTRRQYSPRNSAGDRPATEEQTKAKKQKKNVYVRQGNANEELPSLLRKKNK
ncbi:hypothetical protein LJC42_06450 [Eubacteriales bacterium OttesenSCG-928-K08]|nr:hypothetical protein [Eubacteriales bacterium OttesenSCG-928-K08]